MFQDRTEAATKLAEQLQKYRGRNPLVLAIPRGAVPMAKIIAHALDGEADVVLVRKIPAPGAPEFAIGSVDETGWTYLTPNAAYLGASDAYVEEERERQLQTIRKRRALYTPLRSPIDPAGRIAIVVDDGLATGSTMIAALHALRKRNPATLVCAVPVAPAETLTVVEEYADETVCLRTPVEFMSVGQFYREFEQVTDSEIAELLATMSE